MFQKYTYHWHSMLGSIFSCDCEHTWSTVSKFARSRWNSSILCVELATVLIFCTASSAFFMSLIKTDKSIHHRWLLSPRKFLWSMENIWADTFCKALERKPGHCFQKDFVACIRFSELLLPLHQGSIKTTTYNPCRKKPFAINNNNIFRDI